MYRQSNFKFYTHEAFEAIEKDDVSKLYHLLRAGLDPNSTNENGISLIHKAIDELNPQMVNDILEAGGDPNIISPAKQTFTIFSSRRSIASMPSYKIQDLTPLMSVLNEQEPLRKDSDRDFLKRKNIFLSLINHGAKVNLGESHYGITPIHLAANCARPDFISCLLKNGANPNVLAFYKNESDHEQNIDYKENSNITPMLLAVNGNFKKNASECISNLLNYKGNIALNLNNPDDLNAIIETFSSCYPTRATEVFNYVLEGSHNKMQYNRVIDNLSKFMQRSPFSEKYAENFVSDLLGTSSVAHTLLSDGLYMAHLNSWNGLLAYKGRENGDVEYYSACSWKVYKQIPKKIKNMIMLLKEIESGKYDTQKMLGKNKNDISKILKDEIWVQCTNYFTSQNMYLINSSFLNKMPKIDINNQIETDNLGRIKTIIPFFKKEVSSWCDTISSLKPGNSFCIAAGGSNHAIYIEFRAQKDGNISRYIYNLGAKKELHMMTDDNKIYPHLTVNIPIKLFNTKDDKIINYLSEVIYQKYMLWNNNSRDILYDSKQIEGEISKSTKGLIPMKYQVAGNCSVKNNNAGMYNRMGEIFKFIKNYEIGEIDKNVHIPKRLFHEKEMQHDLSTLTMISQSKLQYPQTVEKELFRFLSNRSTKIPTEIINKPSERISFVLLNMNKASLQYYVINSQEFMSALNCVANYYKDDKLTSIIKKFEQAIKALPITKDILKQDLNSKLFLNLNCYIKEPEVLEAKMYEFLDKRGITLTNSSKEDLRTRSFIVRNIEENSKATRNENIYDNVETKPGFRILEALKNLSPGVLDFYVANNPMTIKYLDTIANYYNLDKLKIIVNSFEKRFVITQKKQLTFYM